MRFKLPGVSAVANFSIANKLALVVVVLAIPVGALLFGQFQDRQEATSFAQSESDGLDYVASVMPFLKEVQLHMVLSQRVLSGDTLSRARLDQSTAAADGYLKAINDVDKKHGDAFGTAKLVRVLNDQWPKVREVPDGQAVEASAVQHTQLIEDGVMPLVTKVATESKLLVDPNVATRNVIVALTQDMPQMTQALSLARATGTVAMFQRKGQPATDQQKFTVAANISTAQVFGEQMGGELEAAMAENPRFEEQLRTLLGRASISRQLFANAAEDGILDAPALVGSAADAYIAQAGSAVDLSNQLLTAAQQTLHEEFDARSADATSDFYRSFATAVGGVLVALALAVFIASTITRPIRHLAEVADRMSLGDLDVDIDVRGTNEVGLLAESLRRMQASLRSAIERLRQRRAAAA
jgi:HAMP domain-containing protein